MSKGEFTDHWHEVFQQAIKDTWPPTHPACLTISKASPSKRSLWDDKAEILIAAKAHGFSVLVENDKIVTFIRPVIVLAK